MNDLTVLYVEDDEIVRENFEQILQRYFSKVIVASNGKQGLQLYQQNQPEIAILDISIPFLSGLEVAAKIREADQDCEIIMLTAYTDQEKLFQAVNLQLFAYLVKPISQTKLDACLRKVISKRQSSNILHLAHDYSWDKKNEILFYHDQRIKLTKNERLIVSILCHSPNRFFSAAYISCSIFEHENDKEIEYNSVVQIISRFKTKTLKNYQTDNFFIQNTYGLGYKVLLDKSK